MCNGIMNAVNEWRGTSREMLLSAAERAPHSNTVGDIPDASWQLARIARWHFRAQNATLPSSSISVVLLYSPLLPGTVFQATFDFEEKSSTIYPERIFAELFIFYG